MSVSVFQDIYFVQFDEVTIICNTCVISNLSFDRLCQLAMFKVFILSNVF